MSGNQKQGEQEFHIEFTKEPYKEPNKPRKM